MTRDGNGRKSVGGRSIRWNDDRAAEAYATGHWVHGTLADALRDAARDTPARVVVVDGDVRLDCRELHGRADALAAALSDRMPGWQRGVVHAAQLARGRRRLPRGDVGRDGRQPHPAVAARPRAALHPRRRRQPDDLRARGVPRPRLRRDAEPRHRRTRLAAGGRRGARERRARTPPTPTCSTDARKHPPSRSTRMPSG